MCPKYFGPHNQIFIYVFSYYSCSYTSTLAACQASNTFQNNISTHWCPAYFSPHLTRYTCQVNTRRSSLNNLYLHVPVYKPSVNKPKVLLQLSQLRWSFIVEFPITRSSFFPNSIMFQKKAKDTSFSGCISTLTRSIAPVCSLNHKHLTFKEYGIGIWSSFVAS